MKSKLSFLMFALTLVACVFAVNRGLKMGTPRGEVLERLDGKPFPSSSAARPGPAPYPVNRQQAEKAIEGRVTRVSDGDTIWVTEANGLRNKIRMLGIDAPESSQAFGGESTRRLAELVNGATVKVTYAERDQYGRILGTVWLGGRNINLQMVSEGYAWAYHYNKDPQYNDAQNAAKARRLGLWAGAAQDPWAYRWGQQGQKRVSINVSSPPARESRSAAGTRKEYFAGRGPIASRIPAPVNSDWPETGYWLSTNSDARHNSRCPNYRKTRGYPCTANEGRPCGKCGG